MVTAFQGILHEEPTLWIWFLVTVLMGGAAAWQAGRATAQTWKPVTQLIPYALLLGAAVRFLHYALFEASLLSLQYYVVDTAVIALAMVAGWRIRRAQQMVTQYSWLYERAGPLGWKTKV
jgi:hypothetical protein